MSNYAKFMAWLVGAWFVAAITASAFHLYQTGPDQLPLPIGLSVTTPVIVFLAWFALSTRFREFAMALSPRVLTLIQAWRILGFVLVVLASYRILPNLFALPAGWGDTAIGITALWVALKLTSPQHRKAFITWQVLGIADLINAPLLGVLARVIDPHGIAASAMTLLPLSVIPTFGVPLFLILHIICIAQALRWREQPSSAGAAGWSATA